MTSKETQEKIAKLERTVAGLTASVAELLRRVAQLEEESKGKTFNLDIQGGAKWPMEFG